jgi:hypothetical protein
VCSPLAPFFIDPLVGHSSLFNRSSSPALICHLLVTCSAIRTVQLPFTRSLSGSDDEDGQLLSDCPDESGAKLVESQVSQQRTMTIERRHTPSSVSDWLDWAGQTIIIVRIVRSIELMTRPMVSESHPSIVTTKFRRLLLLSLSLSFSLSLFKRLLMRQTNGSRRSNKTKKEK